MNNVSKVPFFFFQMYLFRILCENMLLICCNILILFTHLNVDFCFFCFFFHSSHYYQLGLTKFLVTTFFEIYFLVIDQGLLIFKQKFD